MNPDEVLRIVDQIHLDRKIDKEIVFIGIEKALVIAARKHAPDDSVVVVHIDRQTGEISAFRDNVPLSTMEIAERTGAQSAKQVMIQNIREAERDALYDEYMDQMDQLVSGVVHRDEGSVTLVTLSNVEAILPRSEKIPGEKYRSGDRISAVIVDVKKSGTKIKVILSRIRPSLVQKLFEQEIPEIADGVIEIKGISREPGHRSKIAVSCSDPRIDTVGACVGVRGARIRNVVDELSGERIDVVPWSNDMLVFIPRALQPAAVDEVILCAMLGRAIVLVQKDQRSLAIGRKGQNVRLATKLSNWDIEIMTRDELEEQLTQALDQFCGIEGVTPEVADKLVGEGFLSYDDLSIIEPDDLMEMGSLTAEQADEIIAIAEERADEEEARKAQEAQNKESTTGESTLPEDESAQ